MPTQTSKDDLDIISPEDLQKIGETILRKAKSLAPHHISSGITAELVPFRNGYSVLFKVDPKLKDARAWEYGSGLHAQRGRQAKYVISPKNKKVLAFFWEVNKTNGETVNVGALESSIYKNTGPGIPFGLARTMGKFYGIGSDGRLLFNWVEHPGIEAANSGRGYLRAAFDDSKASTRNSIAKMGVQNILLKVRTRFSR